MVQTAKYFAQQMVDSGTYRETNGPNRGDAIDHMDRQMGFDPTQRLSWCAIFACFSFWNAEQSGAQGRHILKTASSQELLRWFRELGLVSSNPQDILSWKGALAIRTNQPDTAHGHVTLLKARFTNSGRVVAVGTLEGNTDAQGSSNGEGAYEHKRNVPMKPFIWTFCNTSGIAGGAWW